MSGIGLFIPAKTSYPAEQSRTLIPEKIPPLKFRPTREHSRRQLLTMGKKKASKTETAVAEVSPEKTTKPTESPYQLDKAQVCNIKIYRLFELSLITFARFTKLHERFLSISSLPRATPRNQIFSKMRKTQQILRRPYGWSLPRRSLSPTPRK